MRCGELFCEGGLPEGHCIMVQLPTRLPFSILDKKNAHLVPKSGPGSGKDSATIAWPGAGAGAGATAAAAGADAAASPAKSASAGAGAGAGAAKGAKKSPAVPMMWGSPDEPTSVRPPCGELPSSGRRIPAGRVGQLLVYKSGHVKMKIGENTYDVTYGVPVRQYQEAAVVSTSTGKFCRVGQLSQRVVVVPEVASMLKDWQAARAPKVDGGEDEAGDVEMSRGL